MEKTATEKQKTKTTPMKKWTDTNALYSKQHKSSDDVTGM